jgi:hypothetical protein
LSEEAFVSYIEHVKQFTALPVCSAEPWWVWPAHPQLAEIVDCILLNIHPYWDGISIEQAAAYVVQKWEAVKQVYPEKEVIIGETGWPTAGDAVGHAIPSEENQRKFLSDFLLAAEERGIQYFYFDAFDEKWKKIDTESREVEAHWGLYQSDGSLKPLLRDMVPPEARSGINRLPRDKKVSTPLFVYEDACSSANHFIPSGWMKVDPNAGIPEDVFDDAFAEAPLSGETCIRINYLPGIENLLGIYWQFPQNNWGELPGYDLSKAARIVFWAKGNTGGESATFHVGGIFSPQKPYPDSFGPISKQVVLTSQWTKYTIDLTGYDLSNVIGGFGWINDHNPEGSKIYLDQIYFANCDADLDCDGDADGADLAIFAANLGRNDCAPGHPCSGDFYSDQDVDTFDLTIFVENFGQTVCPACPF